MTTTSNGKTGLNQHSFKLTLTRTLPFLIFIITQKTQIKFRHSLLTEKENAVVQIQPLSKPLAKIQEVFTYKKTENWAAMHELFLVHHIQQDSALFLGSSQDHQCGCRFQLFSNKEG